jgi:X-Pro dipeptidyl-peptidase
MRARHTLIVLTAVAALGLATVPAGRAVGAEGGLRPRTTNRYSALPMETVMVPRRAGDVYAEIIRPDVPAGKRVPVILTYTPYALFLASADDGIADFFVPKGYARVLAHVPGTGNSGGCWDYVGRRERDSGYDLVKWLGTRDWSNGRVGMIGGSYDGTTANMTAVEQPPHLATIVPEVAISQWYGYSYGDGIRYFIADPGQRQGVVIDEQGFDTPAAFDFGFGLVPPLNPDDANFPNRVVERLCPNLDKVTHTQQGYNFEPDFGQFWNERSYLRDAGKVQVPVLVQGAWRDYNVKSHESTRWFEALPDDIFKLLRMDAVDHGTPTDPRFQWQTLLHAWFDRWLYGYETNVESQPVVLSKANDTNLRASSDWPPPTVGPVDLFLRADGRLTTTPSGAAEVLGSYTDTALTTESEVVNRRHSDGIDFLWFESAPLKKALRVAGTPRLALRATSSAISTHYEPVIFDLGMPVASQPQCNFLPPTQACTMDRGFLNARFRNGLAQGQDLVPGQPYDATVRFIGNDWVVPAGHRIGVAVMSSNLWWALPDQLRAQNTLLAGTRLVLPVAGGPQAAASAGL